MIKTIIISVAVAAISACASGTTSKPARTVSSWSPYDANTAPVQVAPFKYEPAGRQEFVMETYKDRKFDYRSFCTTATPHCDPLKYAEYVGKRGYFETDSPVKSDSYYNYWIVVFENGQRLYYSTSKKYEDRFFAAQFVKLEIFEKNKADLEKAKREPLIPGSSIYVVGTGDNVFIVGTGEFRTYKLSNGASIRVDQLTEFRKLARRIKPFNEDVLDSLTRMEFQIDKVRNVVFVKPVFTEKEKKEPSVYLYIAATDNNATLRFSLKYRASSWLFVDSFTVAADDYRWTSSGKTRWSRDNGGGDIWEWIDVTAGPRLLSVSKRIANTNESTIRFTGRQYYDDYEVPAKAKADMLKMIRLYQHIS